MNIVVFNLVIESRKSFPFANNHTSGSLQTHMYFQLSLLSTQKLMSAATQATK